MPKQPKKQSSLSRKVDQDTKLSEALPLLVEKVEEWRKQWRLHRKLTAKSTPLEFCLRPFFALLLYTLSVSLLGRGLSHLHGETPYWALWWNEGLATPLSWIMSNSWTSYSTDPRVESLYWFVETCLMWGFLTLAFITAYAPRHLSQSLRNHGQASSLDLRGAQIKRNTPSSDVQRLAEPPKSAKIFLRVFILAGLLQLFYVTCLWLSHEWRWATLAEHLLQVGLPFSCALMLPYMPQQWELPTERVIYLLLSLCFIGHGVYALDIQPTPADFVSMTMNILSLQENNAHLFLSFFGGLDFVAAFGIWIPIKEIKRSALVYMMIWGTLTALARPLGQPAFSFIERVIVWGPEMIWRLSHMLVPFWIWQRAYKR